MPAITTELLDRLTAQQNKPVALAYGRHLVAGNLVLRDDDTTNNVTILMVALGEGEWDSVEELRLNGLLLDASKYHFHPGKDGEPGTGGVDGDQKIDAWFPAGIEGLTFSRTAYVAIRSEEDIEAPTSEFLVLGKYKTRKVRKFDSAGAETAFEYSANPAWQVLDMLLLREPTSRIDFASFAAAEATCDAQISVNGVMVSRFESHVAFPAQVSLGDALQAILNTCRGYLFDDAGKISMRVDQTRGAVHAFSDKLPSNIVDGSFRFWTRDISAATNRLKLKYRDLDNDFAFSDVLVERESAQELIGKLVDRELNLGNTFQQQARRIGQYFVTRAVDDRRMVSVRGLQDSIHLLVGDRVDVEHTLAPWEGKKAFEVIEVTEQSNEEREFLLQEYDVAAFTDAADPNQDLEGGVIVSAIARPPLPGFGANVRGDGLLRVNGIGFPVLDNSTKFVDTATFQVHHRSDIVAEATTLAAGVDALETSWTVANGAALLEGDLVAVGREVVKVDSINGNAITVARAQKESFAEAHSSAAKIWTVRRSDFVFTFPFNAFSGLSGSIAGAWEGTAELGSQRVVAIDCFVTNRKGDSPTKTVNFSQLLDAGLRVFNGGQLDFTVPGLAAIGSCVAPPLTVERAMPIRSVVLRVEDNKEPLGADLLVDVVVGGVKAIAGVKIAAGEAAGGTAAGVELGFVPADTPVSIDITQVGSTFPGETLVASVRF